MGRDCLGALVQCLPWQAHIQILDWLQYLEILTALPQLLGVRKYKVAPPTDNQHKDKLEEPLEY